MIFVTGGACEGKKAFARSLFNDDENSFSEKLMIGGKDNLMTAFIKPYISDYQQIVYELTENSENSDDFTRRLIAAKPELVIMDEVGCGIVPEKREERDYRDAAGRAGQMLAAAADEVYRVTCGIGVRIK